MYLKRINILSIDTANKIAAGEVIERPSSVIKELVENSIDAGAKNISIEIIEGGQRCMKVIDDGQGIHPDDIDKAFLTHATSKINTTEDIFNISTLGFRGEALPSIASISQTMLRSRTSQFSHGREVSINGGTIEYIKDTGLNIGTIIEVNNLFFNVPARLKFLKSATREGSLISDLINKMALANPDIAFKLVNNDKRTLQTYGTGSLMDTLRIIYGKGIVDNIINFETHSDIASVHGYIGNTELSRGSRNNQTIFVNKRFVRNKLITAAVENAYKSFLTVNKYPFFILFLDIFPEFVDVNIHPTKAEIKFSDERAIFKLVFDSVHQALKGYIKNTFNISSEAEKDNNLTKNFEKISYFDNSFSSNSPEKIMSVDLPIDLHKEHIITAKEIKDYNEDYNSNKNSNALSVNSNKDIIPISYNINVETELSSMYNNAKLPELFVIGQFTKTYILAESAQDLYIIDQHAAHEKILFEKYVKQIETECLTTQILLTPVVLELDVDDYIYYEENIDVFQKSGFVIDVFGDNTITIREVPYILGELNIKSFFLSIIDNLKNLGSGKTVAVKHNSIAKLACKAAIKANHTLSEIELKSLLDDLRFADDPFNCPHGRPTIIKFSEYELEKKFKRVT
jgi:DNA mismatch repair protein MutL